ncbi:hypothetical protein BDW69DRAFT_166872 [Aspergillus filifer]
MYYIPTPSSCPNSRIIMAMRPVSSSCHVHLEAYTMHCLAEFWKVWRSFHLYTLILYGYDLVLVPYTFILLFISKIQSVYSTSMGSL